MLRLSPDTQMTVTFVMILFVGDPYGTNIKMIKIMSLSMVYRMLFGLKRKPGPSKYTIWTDSVHLTDSSCYLHDQLNFDSYSEITITKKHIVLTQCGHILTVCNTFSIIPSILSTLTDVKGSNKK